MGCTADHTVVRAWKCGVCGTIHTDCCVGNVVELEHDLPQLHSPSIFQIDCGESSLFSLSHTAAWLPAEPMARAASRAPFGPGIPNPNFFNSYNGSDSPILRVDAALRPFPAIFPRRLSAWVCRGIGALLHSRVFRARSRNEEQLRDSVQCAVFQRWLPRRASLVADRALEAIARPHRSRREYKPLASGASLD